MLASFDNYDGLCNAVRERVEAIGITRLELTTYLATPTATRGKLLGPAQRKKFGKHSLERTLRGTG